MFVHYAPTITCPPSVRRFPPGLDTVAAGEQIAIPRWLRGVGGKDAVANRLGRLPVGQFSGDAPSRGRPGVLPVGQFSATLIALEQWSPFEIVTTSVH
jgi:hypothetical protein